MAWGGRRRGGRVARAGLASIVLIAAAGSLLAGVADADGPLDPGVVPDPTTTTTTTTTTVPPPPTTVVEPPAAPGPVEEPVEPVTEPSEVTTTASADRTSVVRPAPSSPATTADAEEIGPPEHPSVTTITGPGSVEVSTDIQLDITVTRLTLPGLPAGDVDLYRSDLGASPVLIETLPLTRSGRRGHASYDEVDDLAVGDHTYTAVYSLRDTDAHPFTVQVTSEEAPPASLSSRTALSAPDPVAFAEDFDVSLTVSNASGYLHAAPTGSVDVFRQGPEDVGPVLVDTVSLTGSAGSGVAVSTQSDDLLVGTYLYTASYAGETPDGEDAFYAASDSTPVAVEVVRAESTISVTLDDDEIGFGDDIGIDVQVARAPGQGTGPVPTGGNVSVFVDGTFSFGSNLIDGHAGFTDNPLILGDVLITATYDGAPGTYAGSGPSAAQALHIVPSPQRSATSIVGDASVPYAEDFDLDLAVANAGSFSWFRAPTGSVEVYRQGSDDATPVLVDTLTVVDALVGGGATGTYAETDDLPVGTYSYTASYRGESTGPDAGYYSASHADPVDVEVTPADSSIALHASADSILTTGSVTLTAEVARDEAGAGPVPTGSVVFTQDGVPLRTVPLGGGQAELEVTTPTSGDHVYAATYLGEPGTYAASGPTRHTVTVSVPPVPNIEVHASVGAPGPSGSVVSIRATVTGGDPTRATPTGEVQFTVTSTESGRSRAAGAVDQATLPLGSAFVRTLRPGDYTVVAAYLGSAAFSPRSATSTVHVAEPPEPPVPPVDPTEPDPPIVIAPVVPPPTSDDATPTTTPTTTPTATPDEDPAPREPKRHDPATPPEESPVEADEPSTGETAQGAPAVVVSGGVHTVRSPLLRGVPDPDDLSWSPRHLGTNMMLALLLIILIGLPAELVNSTLKEHYDRINKPFVGIRHALDALEGHLRGLPNPLLMVMFAMLGALIASELDPSFGVNSTSITLFVALALAFMVITAVLELARIPYLHRRHGERRRHHLRLFPLALVMGTVFVIISRITEFRPGYIFGITCGLVLAEEIGEEDNARSLAAAGGLLVVTAIAAWILWLPWSSAVQEANPSLTVVFMDAFLATLWISALQVVIFGFAPVEALYGKIVQRWHFGVWAALYGTAMLLLVQFLLHPTANRWGGVSSSSFLSMLTLFIVFLVGAVVFWGWHRFRPAPERPLPPDADSDLVSVG